ncbi:MAG: polysaccharide pyruvyl transferase family protein [Oscillospiraceae bacterium]|nr:polysaccharide pyruvyl transferase family protein [Oscillospiraceae bacterium]
MNQKDILYPLRRLHGMLHEWHMTNQYVKSWWGKNAGIRVLLPGLPDHTNLGDSAISIAQRLFLIRSGISPESIREVGFSEYPSFRRRIRRLVKKHDLIVHLGGGNMGSQWKREENFHRLLLSDFPQNPTVVFPQTIYYAETEEEYRQSSIPVYNDRPKLIIVAREKKSLELVQKLYPNTLSMLAPDIVLSADMSSFGVEPQPRHGVLFCMRNDPERAMTDEQRAALEGIFSGWGKEMRHTDMHANVWITKENRGVCVKEKLEEIASAELVITDRLHGMIFAAITGTPCIAFGNYNYKVRGTYEWISYLPYIRFAETVEDAERMIPDLMEMKDCRFDNKPLQPYFETLAQVVRSYANN